MNLLNKTNKEKLLDISVARSQHDQFRAFLRDAINDDNVKLTGLVDYMSNVLSSHAESINQSEEDKMYLYYACQLACMFIDDVRQKANEDMIRFMEE